MAITAPNVVRFTINGLWSGARPIATVLDYHIDTTGGTVSRSDAILAHAFDVVQNWQSQVIPAFCDNYSVVDINYLDLDTVDGPAGVVARDTTIAATGGSAGQSLPPNCAVLILKSHNGGRGTKPGRIYMPGMMEGDTDENGIIIAADVTGFQGRFTNFLNNTTQAQPLDDFDAYMVVTHFGPRPTPPDPDNRVGVPHRVDALIVQSKVATQRRRLRP